MSFPKKPPRSPKVKIVVPDESGAMVFEEVELSLKNRDDLDQIMWSLTALLDGEKKPLNLALDPAEVNRLKADALARVPVPRRELLRTALDLLQLRNLSISYVPGGNTEPHYYAVLLALYTMESFDGVINVTRLHKATQIPQTTLLRLIDRMLADGLVTRSESITDGRLALIELTPRARDLLDLFFNAARDAMRRK